MSSSSYGCLSSSYILYFSFVLSCLVIFLALIRIFYVDAHLPGWRKVVLSHFLGWALQLFYLWTKKEKMKSLQGFTSPAPATICLVIRSLLSPFLSTRYFFFFFFFFFFFLTFKFHLLSLYTLRTHCLHTRKSYSIKKSTCTCMYSGFLYTDKICLLKSPELRSWV